MARRGERMVLILADDPVVPNTKRRIALAGYGRMPVIAVDGDESLDVGAGFFVPDGANSVRVQVPNADFAVPLSWLRDYVRSLASQPASPTK